MLRMSELVREDFSFAISLSVLNHLGRQLYRSFSTVLGEAISNAWDADAHNIWIVIDRENSVFVIKDDGTGMSSDDFQNKFLKIGFSKRKEGGVFSPLGRPYIGRKGIGKLALLSCAETITVISKTKDTDFIGGVIDNAGLDRAIKDDLTPDQYPLASPNIESFGDLVEDFQQGTIIRFDGFKDGIRNTVSTLKKTIALYFRFSLFDTSLNIYVNGELVDSGCLSDLLKTTDFLWEINHMQDPYVAALREAYDEDKDEYKSIDLDKRIRGFIASVTKPSNLKVIGTDETVTVDLFVNGRLREKDILKHIPTARVVESYLYGQIHFDALDDSEDRFTSSRESVVENDPLFNELLESLRDKVMKVVLTDWDTWRIKHRHDGDSENPRISKKARKSGELFNAVAKDYSVPKVDRTSESAKVASWVRSLADDATFNFESYAECFVAENLIRMYIQDKSIPLSDEAIEQIDRYIGMEKQNKTKGNISIEIRREAINLSYLDMSDLAHLVDKTRGTNDLPADSREYKPIRDAVMHTSLLSEHAKLRLTAIFQNIQGRVKALLLNEPNI